MGKSRNRDYDDDQGGRDVEDRREKRKKKNRDRDPELESSETFYDPFAALNVNPRKRK